MNYEEKVKRYDEALERAKKEWIENLDNCYTNYRERLEIIFPELKEVKDELIKDDIKDIIQAAIIPKESKREMLDWLEKQSEKKSADEVLKIRQELYQSGYNDGYKHGQEDISISLEEIILNVWELGNYWKELTKGVCNTEYGSQLDYIVKHWKEGEYYIKSFEKQSEQQPADDKKLDVLKFIRKETCCGLAEADNALLKLIKVLKERPLPIMDKPHKLKIEWEKQQ